MFYVIPTSTLHYIFDLTFSFFISADDSIRQTLNMLKTDYPDVDSPAKVVVDASPLPGGAIFAATPLPFALDKDGSSKRIAGPLFDAMPTDKKKKNDDIEETTPSSTIPSHRPQWQDTSSQSVDGTKEVTQEHMVEEQLAK